ncbi:hypothetical protein BIV57_14980 [Mangrovactinospora gilvigrisea]|uniref:Major facilitator superfamily (MFS) profile domain-containing protein n=1 Tax=Mangrovactinospora gilvigrisea TaxID=1428644 RepID=A0A1J7C539_9ACTN|nr:MFS transporter [Mangrovactinospora gilvigrisea]OIV36672.1 hypothetical protein BIV57_14980 [Mangrovactinospora gilvigrisea]
MGDHDGGSAIRPGTGFRLRGLAAPVYLPTVLFGIGEGATAPVVVLAAHRLGADTATAGLVFALIGVGSICGDVPAGVLAGRFGERRVMLGSVLLTALSMVGCLLAGQVWQLGAAVFCEGLATSAFGLARHAFLATSVPMSHRARAMSLLGGASRVGLFVGPFLAALVMGFGGLRAAFWVHLVVALLAGASVLLLRDVEKGSGSRPDAPAAPRVSLRQVLADHRRVFATLGTGVLLIGAVRATRVAAVPLWAAHIGLDARQTSLVFGFSSGLEMLLFYPAGKVMDRLGRAFVAVPCMVILALGHAALLLASGFASLLAVSMALGFGNGIGSGIVLTLGADAAPERGRTTFLGAWRLAADGGSAVGPLMVSAVTAAASLGAGLVVMAGMGMAGAGVFAKWIPRRPGVTVRSSAGAARSGPGAPGSGPAGTAPARGTDRR